MILSNTANKIAPSPTLAIAAKARALKAAGSDIINLSAGEPDYSSPEWARNAVVQALQNPKQSGIDYYTAVAGVPSLRSIIAQKYSYLNYSQKNIIITNGGKESLFISLMAIINPGDLVAFASPFWNSYPEMIRMLGGIPVVIKTQDDCKLTYNIFASSLVNKKIKAVILNSPSNPTGKIINTPELKKIAEYCVQQNIIILSDEVYEPFTYEGKHSSAAEFAPQYAIISSAVSKMYAMTGWRCGWIAAPENIIQAADAIKGNLSSNLTVAAQIAAEAALRGDQSFITKMVADFKQRRDSVVMELNKIKGIKCDLPEGAFYVFPSIKSFNIPSEQFVTNLLNQQKVALIHGSAFGAEGFVRISYAASPESLREGIARIALFVKSL